MLSEAKSVLQVIIFIVEFFLFSGFIWVIVAWFKKGNKVERWEMKFIKVAGLGFTIAHLTAAAFYPSTTLLFSVIGILLLLLSATLFLWSISAFKKQPPAIAFAETIVRPLNTSGPYSIIRHPFYSSYSIAWIGGTIATQCWWLIISFFCMFFIYYRAAKLEEQQWLNSKDAEVYKNYLSKTGMFFPWM